MELSQSNGLTALFGKGFDVSNLRTMRRFYQALPIRDAVRLELGWTHYRALFRVENRAVRAWDMAKMTVGITKKVLGKKPRGYASHA